MFRRSFSRYSPAAAAGFSSTSVLLVQAFQGNAAASSSSSSTSAAAPERGIHSKSTLPLPNDFLGKSRTLEEESARRKAGQKKTMDDILRDVMNDALAARDRGEQPNMDFVYKTAQERIYEEEYGEKPPTSKSNHRQHIPFPPRENLRRIVPVTLFDSDPWPLKEGERVYEACDEEGKEIVSPKTEAAPAKTQQGGGGGDAAAEAEEEEVAIVEKKDVEEQFLDSADELAHWERKYIDFIRGYPLGLRRTLPLYIDCYKHLTHRLARAERRFIQSRDGVVSAGVASPKFFAATERRVDRVRKIYIETHKSLTQQNYDPTKIRKAVTGKLLEMSEAEFEAWLERDRDERNEDFANMRGEEADS